MNRRCTLDTAILLPFITSLAAYILIFSHLSHPGCHLEISKQNDLTYPFLSTECKEKVVQANSLHTTDLVVLESTHTTTK
jgi:hypothetical protein